MMKGFRIFVLAVVAVLIAAMPAFAAQKILMAVFADNPDYISTRMAFQAGVERAAGLQGIDVQFEEFNTQGDRAAFMEQIKAKAEGAAIVFTTGTPNALAIKEAGVTQPVIFSAIASPVGAKLVQSLEAPGTNFTGAHCAVPEARQLRALQMVIPNAKRIGVLYNAADPAPAAQARSWKAAIEAAGLEYVEFLIPPAVSSADMLAEATKPMVGKVDVIVTTADAKVSPFGEGMLQVANANKIPTYVSLGQLVSKGALVSLGFNFPEGARLVNVPQAIQILQGDSPATVPVGTFVEYSLVVNNRVAQAIGVPLPPSALKIASQVIN